MTRPLADLTDRDMLLNLWTQLLIACEAYEIPVEEWVTSVGRIDVPEPAPDDRHATLSDLLDEVAQRLEITGFEIESDEELQH